MTVGALAAAAAFGFVASGGADGLTHELNELARGAGPDVSTTETTSAIVSAPEIALFPQGAHVVTPSAAPVVKPLPAPALSFAPLAVLRIPAPAPRPLVAAPIDPDLVAPVTVPTAAPGIPRPAPAPRTEMAGL